MANYAGGADWNTAYECRITYEIAKYLPGSDGGEFITNSAGNYCDLNHGGHVRGSSAY